jgi:hypothetical protein
MSSSAALAHGIEPAIIEFAAVDVGVDLETIEPEIAMHSLHLGHSRPGVVHRQVGHAHESLRMGGHDCGDPVILDGGDPDPGGFVQVVEVLRWGDRQHLKV